MIPCRTHLRSFILVCLLLVSGASDATSSESAPAPATPTDDAETSLWNYHPPEGAPVLSTDIVGLTLQGPWRLDRISVLDLDILTTEDGRRLIPLLRILRLVQARGKIEAPILAFRAESGPGASINLRDKTMLCDGREYTIEVVTGISDVTGEPEIFVSENVLGLALGYEVSWDENFFQYTLETDKELELFKQRRPKSVSAFSIKVEDIVSPLAETEPPAHPSAVPPFLSFFETDMRLTSDTTWHNKKRATTLRFFPSIDAWGHVWGGDYKVRIRNDLQYPHTDFPRLPSWFDRLLWTRRTPRSILRIGDTNIGLSELVAPSVTLFGSSFKWISQTPGEKGEGFFRRGRGHFPSVQAIEGVARLNSKVELYVNNRLVDSTTVEQSGGAPPGQGVYRFEDISLLEKSVNEIKLVVTRDDGIVEEYYRQILGSAQILQPGQWAVTAGVGTDREEVDENIRTQGLFSGVQVYRGLTRDLTMGLSAGVQDRFTFFKDDNGRLSRDSTGIFIGQQTRWRLLDRFLFSGDVALSSDSEASTAAAYRFRLEYPSKRLSMSADYFNYGKDFSNAVTTISNKGGYSLNGRIKLFHDWIWQLGWLRIRDNLDDSLQVTAREDLLNSNLILPRILPGTTLSLQVARSDRIDGNERDIRGNRYTVTMESRLSERLNLTGRYGFGDDITISDTDGLKSDIPVDIGEFYSFGTHLRANYRLDNSHNLSLAYFESSFQQQVELQSRYRPASTRRWENRLIIGKELRKGSFFTRDYFEYFLDQAHHHSCGLTVTFDEDKQEVFVGFVFKARDLFEAGSKGIHRITRRGVSPEQGSLIGTVYFDKDADGHRDPDEPTVPGIRVLVDGRRALTTDAAGRFYVPRRSGRAFAEVSLDVKALSALYTPTQGRQRGFWQRGRVTRVNLGVTILSSLAGTVRVRHPEKGRPPVLPGARVLLVRSSSQTTVSDSIAAGDGTYYFGEIRPGTYRLLIDPESLPPGYRQVLPPPVLAVTASEEGREMEDVDIWVDRDEIPSQPKDTGGPPETPQAADAASLIPAEDQDRLRHVLRRLYQRRHPVRAAILARFLDVLSSP